MISEHAIVHPNSSIAKNVSIGPWSIIGEGVTIGEGSTIGPHVVINGVTNIGKNNKIYQFASIGEDPQDKKYGGEKTFLEMGDNNVVREYCTINRGTVQGGGSTRIGDDNLFMAYTHIAHDCIIGNEVIFANNASLAGHVTVCNYANLSGFSGIHQFCCVGEYSFVGKGALVTKDVPPYFLVAGIDKPAAYGLNVEGLRRRGFSKETVSALRGAYKVIYQQGLTLEDAIKALDANANADTYPEITTLTQFLKQTKRGIIRSAYVEKIQEQTAL